jgi:hypothetical protein
MKSFHTEANHMQTTNSGPTLQARDSLKQMKPKDLSNDMYSYIINANKFFLKIIIFSENKDISLLSLLSHILLL